MIIQKKGTLVKIKKISTNSGYYPLISNVFEKTFKLINSIEKGYPITATILEEELIIIFDGMVLKISEIKKGFYLVETETSVFEVEEI